MVVEFLFQLQYGREIASQFSDQAITIPFIKRDSPSLNRRLASPFDAFLRSPSGVRPISGLTYVIT
jgi:hypothetical protein